MNKENYQTGLKILNAAAFLFTVTINALANILPFNGLQTGDVSKLYSNLFTPAGFTFSIWGVIYFLLAGFVLYQFGMFGSTANELIRKISPYFLVSCLANAAWLFAWHYKLLFLSVILMFLLLFCLAKIVGIIQASGSLTKREQIFIKIPFSIYFGWITVAAIANVAAFLVSIGWNGWGISPEIWTVIAIFLGLLITGEIMLKNGDIAYGVAAMWGYFGILWKHLSPDGFSGKYSIIIASVVISLGVLAAVAVSIIVSQIKSKKG